MESAQLLDILGNENRRKILHLLASRPCYMSEIAERLDVGAKAVLGHLELLVRAGLIEANVDEQRRKYFHIADNLRLEVFVSPYSFEMATTIITAELEPQHQVRATPALSDLKTLYIRIHELAGESQRIMLEYQQVQSSITDAMGQCMGAIGEVADDPVEAEIFYALLKGPMSERALSMQLGIPEYVIEERLERMHRKDMIKLDGNNYSID
ncbi:MAG: ArsR family transcriptional regulator [Candidatus Brocadiaceae bacterium]|nr:ArsR family transcriptional regulator [Candidatus Brocadiaceae bacterium]